VYYILVTIFIKFILLFAFPFQLLANTCPDLRLDSPNHSMEHVNVTSQDGLGVCYAYAATQMLDAVFDTEDKLLKKSVNKGTSSSLFSAVVALEHYSNDGKVVLRENGNYRFPFEGGHICESFNYIRSVGACPDQKIQKYLRVIQNGKGILDVSTPYKFFAEIYKVFDVYNSSLETNTSSPSPIYGLFNDDEEEYSCYDNAVSKLKKKLKLIFGDDAPNDLFLHAAFNSKNGPIAAFGKFMLSLCPASERRKPLVSVSCQDVSSLGFYKNGSEPKLKFTNQLLTQLSTSKLPVGISYCSEVLLKGKSYSGVKSHQLQTFDKSCGHHASVVIGSRQKNGQCELLVRNSWGTGCGSYHKDFECENGNIWIPAQTMENNAYQFSKMKVGL
jgi:hypothetical protein